MHKCEVIDHSLPSFGHPLGFHLIPGGTGFALAIHRYTNALLGPARTDACAIAFVHHWQDMSYSDHDTSFSYVNWNQTIVRMEYQRVPAAFQSRQSCGALDIAPALILGEVRANPNSWVSCHGRLDTNEFLCPMLKDSGAIRMNEQQR
jgi:hypothetical protein